MTGYGHGEFVFDKTEDFFKFNYIPLDEDKLYISMNEHETVKNDVKIIFKLCDESLKQRVTKKLMHEILIKIIIIRKNPGMLLSLSENVTNEILIDCIRMFDVSSEKSESKMCESQKGEEKEVHEEN